MGMISWNIKITHRIHIVKADISTISETNEKLMFTKITKLLKSSVANS